MSALDGQVVKVDAVRLEEFARQILMAAGLGTDDAGSTARGLVAANLCGIDSHGVLRLIQYADSLAGGAIESRPEIRIVRRSGATALLDAGGGYGYRPSDMAVDLAVELAREAGVGFVCVRKSHHFGMAGLYTARGAAQGMITFAWTNASPRMAPPSGVSAVVGNNPLSWAVPRRSPHPPIVLDMALSAVAFGKIRLAHAEGRPLPQGWGLDANGRPTTDATEAFESGLLAPIGGHKGYGLSLIAEILAGCLTGSPFGLAAAPHAGRSGGVGHVFTAIDPDALADRQAFEEAIEALVEQVRTVPSTAESGGVLLPGEIEHRRVEERRRDGVPLSAALARQLVALAKRLEVPADAFGVSATPDTGYA